MTVGGKGAGRGSRRAILFWIVFLLVATLSPFELHRVPDLELRGFDPLDFLQNLVLFLPLGLSLGGRPFFSLLVGAVLSCSIEAAQAWLYRGPSMFDVLANALGCAAGSIPALRARWERARGWLTKPALFGVLLLCSLCGIEVFRRRVVPNDFRNWEPYELVLGGEAGIDRPWSGILHRLEIHDRAGTPDRHGGVAVPEGLAPVLAIQGGTKAGAALRKEGAIRHLDLEPPEDSGALVSEAGIVLRGARWKLPSECPDAVREALMRTGEVTVLADVTPDTDEQGGQGRIVSLGLDFERRNFTLGQKHRNVHWRVRTPMTGDNGDRPQIVTRSAPLSPRRHVLIASFSLHRSRLWVDGKIAGDLLLSTSRPRAFLFFGTEWALLDRDIGATIAIACLLAALFGAAQSGRPWIGVLFAGLFFLSVWGGGAMSHFDGYAPKAAAAAALLVAAAWPFLSRTPPKRPRVSRRARR